MTSKESNFALKIAVGVLAVINVVLIVVGAYVGMFDFLKIKQVSKPPAKVAETALPQETPSQEESSPEEPPEFLEQSLAEEPIEESPEEPLEALPEKLPEPPAPPIKKKIIPIAKGDVNTGYDPSQEILNNDGLCEFTIDNTRNDMPVYVRIWDMEVVQPVRAFTIAKGEKFTALNLSPSTYEIRYIELYENDVPPYGSKSEPFVLKQSETFTGITYDVMTLTLYKVRDGNTQTYSISADDI